MPVGECMRAHTHRQYMSWMHWLNEEWDNPSRSDLYLIQIACEVRRVLAKNPGKITMEDLKLKFTPTSPAPSTGRDTARATLHSQSRWFGALGLPLPLPGADEG